MSNELKVVMFVVLCATAAVITAVLCGEDGFIMGSYFGSLGIALGYVLRIMREKRKEKK